MSRKNSKIKDLYNKIVENRYIISLVAIVISAIVGFFINNVSVQEWLLTTDKVLSLWWSVKFFALILASYELFYIITNKNKDLSVAGTIVLAFSGCVQWNFTKIDSIVFGEIITILIYKIITTDNLKKNVISALAIAVCCVSYMYTFRPFAIGFGYIFFALILWIILQNINELKKDKKKIIMLIVTILMSIVAAICAEIFFKNCYVEDANESLNSGLSGLFTYLYTPLLPYNNFEKREVFGGILSFFPIPMCIALYYMYKKEEHGEFLLPMVTVAVLETVYCVSGFPEILGKLTMLSGAEGLRIVPAVQLANLFIIFYFLGNIEMPVKLKYAIRITILSVLAVAIIKYPEPFTNKGFLYLFTAELSLLVFLFLNYSDKKYKKVFLFFLVLITLIGGIPVCLL